jgi:hypothetical protein
MKHYISTITYGFDLTGGNLTGKLLEEDHKDMVID